MEKDKELFIPMYVLNNYIKFERKIYQLFGLRLGRPIRAKAAIYFIVSGIITVIWSNIPILKLTISWLPMSVKVLIPIGIAWLLADVGTESRSPVSFFRSFITYQIRKRRHVTFIQGREIPQLDTHSFKGYVTMKDFTVSKKEWKAEKESEKLIEEQLQMVSVLNPVEKQSIKDENTTNEISFEDESIKKEKLKKVKAKKEKIKKEKSKQKRFIGIRKFLHYRRRFKR